MVTDPELFSAFHGAGVDAQRDALARIAATTVKYDASITELMHQGEVDPILRRAAVYMLQQDGLPHDAVATREWRTALSAHIRYGNALGGGTNALIKAFESFGIVPHNSPYAHERKHSPLRLASLEKPLIAQRMNAYLIQSTGREALMEEILLLQQFKMAVTKNQETSEVLLQGVNKALGQRVAVLVEAINKDERIFDIVDINKRADRGIE